MKVWQNESQNTGRSQTELCGQKKKTEINQETRYAIMTMTTKAKTTLTWY